MILCSEAPKKVTRRIIRRSSEGSSEHFSESTNFSCAHRIIRRASK
uniref:Uncharacterized protein n=1 Tax=Arundo donax TaxID=35708 RepID=A0A0A9F9E1_ARUDO